MMVGRGCPCPVAGRSLRPSWAPLTRRRLRSAILAPLAANAGSRDTGSPSLSVSVMCVGKPEA
jgi:hypothetical protein